MRILLTIFFVLLVASTALCVVKAGAPGLDPATRETWRSGGHASLVGLGLILATAGVLVLRRMWRAGYAQGLAWDVAAFGPLTSVEEHARRRSVVRRQTAGIVVAVVWLAVVVALGIKLDAGAWMRGPSLARKLVGVLLFLPLLHGAYAGRRSLRNRVAGYAGLVDFLLLRRTITAEMPPHWRPHRVAPR